MVRLASSSAAAAALLIVPATAAAGAGFLPPMEVEVGAASIRTPDGATAAATEVLVGVSSASLWPRPTPVDVSVGMITVDGIEAAPVRAMATARTTAAPTPPSVDATGGYLDVAIRLDRGPHWRAWAGARGELMSTEGVGVLGGAGRISFELWSPVTAGGSGGLILGALAISGWAEVGVRERADRSIATIAAAGLGVRIPLVLVTR